MKKTLVFLSILLISALVFGQAETTGRITGTVTDEDGQPVVGALVTAQSPALLGERQQKTSARGEFLFALLPVGPYRVSISAPGKKTMDFTFQLNLGKTVPLNVTMQTGQDIVEEVTVFGTATRFETTAGGENFNLDTTVEELPIQGRGLESIAFNAPNMASGPNSTPRIAGANAFDTVVLLDGAEISDPLFGGGTGVYIEDAIQEVQVLTSGVSARYGRFQGGVLNAITKTGGNEFTATVRLEYNNDDWDSVTPYDKKKNTKIYNDTHYTALGTFGGYVLKDRLWWFFAGWYEPSSSSSRTTRAGQSYATTSSEDRYQYKLTGAITPDHVIDVNYLDFSSDTSNYAGLPAGDLNFAKNGTRSDPRDMTTVSYQGVLTPSLFLDMMYTKKNAAISGGGNPNAGTPIYEGREFRFYHNMWWDATDKDIRNNETYNANLTYTYPTDGWGNHTFEAGAQSITSTTGGSNRQSATGFNYVTWAAGFIVTDTNGDPIVHPDGEVHFNLVPNTSSRLWVALPFKGEQSIDYTAAYLQDSWEIGKWRVDLGLRWEDYSGDGPLATNLINYNSLSPRLGVTFNINQDWQVQASWGHYQGRFNDSYAQNASGIGNAPRKTLANYSGPNCLNCTGDQLDPLVTNESNWGPTVGYNSPEFPTTILADDLESGYAQDVNFSVKRALPNNTGTVEVRYTNRSFHRLVDDFIGGDVAKVIDVTLDGTSFGKFDQTVWANTNLAKRDYQAITMTWDYRPNVTWNLGGNYTWSTLTGNYTGEGTNTPASGSAIGIYPLVTPSVATPTGYLPGDVRHRIRAWGAYRFDFNRWGGLTLGSIFRFASGSPWAHAAGGSKRWVDNPAMLQDRESTYTHYFEARGANTFNSSWAIDFSARWQIQIWKDLSAWLKVNAINVLDRDNLVTYKTSVERVTSEVEVVDLQGHPLVDASGNPTHETTDQTIGYKKEAGYGAATGRGDYLTPRTYLITIGLTWK